MENDNMLQSVLIAFDLSENSSKAVDYVGAVMGCHPTVKITLLHVIKEPSPDIVPDARERQNYVERKCSEALAKIEEAAGRLVSRGLPERHIQIKIQICRMPVSIAELILYEQKNGCHGTIVIGRRGVSKKEEFLFGSVSSAIVREARLCTVWVVE